jgi:hypothetical protein
MESPSPKTNNEFNKDETYLKIWEIEQSFTERRWTVVTFFMSVSFAIFGLSLQVEKPIVPLIVPQLSAVAIYWFTYLLFLRFNDFTAFLRAYLQEMELANQTTINLQSKSKEFLNARGKPSSTRLLLYFGIAYTIAGIAIGFLFQH